MVQSQAQRLINSVGYNLKILRCKINKILLINNNNLCSKHRHTIRLIPNNNKIFNRITKLTNVRSKIKKFTNYQLMIKIVNTIKFMNHSSYKVVNKFQIFRHRPIIKT